MYNAAQRQPAIAHFDKGVHSSAYFAPFNFLCPVTDPFFFGGFLIIYLNMVFLAPARFNVSVKSTNFFWVGKSRQGRTH